MDGGGRAAGRAGVQHQRAAAEPAEPQHDGAAAAAGVRGQGHERGADGGAVRQPHHRPRALPVHHQPHLDLQQLHGRRPRHPRRLPGVAARPVPVHHVHGPAGARPGHGLPLRHAVLHQHHPEERPAHLGPEPVGRRAHAGRRLPEQRRVLLRHRLRRRHDRHGPDRRAHGARCRRDPLSHLPQGELLTN